jgi:preprotein translocase subunit SecF
VALSLGSLVWRGLNYSVEFTGGVAIEASYGQPADLEAIRKNLADAGFEDVHTRVLGATTDALITLRPPERNADVGALRDRVLQVLRLGQQTVDVRRFDTIGPQVGSDLARSSVLAVLVASLCIFIYVALRFRWKLAVAMALLLKITPADLVAAKQPAESDGLP